LVLQALDRRSTGEGSQTYQQCSQQRQHPCVEGLTVIASPQVPTFLSPYRISRSNVQREGRDRGAISCTLSLVGLPVSMSICAFRQMPRCWNRCCCRPGTGSPLAGVGFLYQNGQFQTFTGPNGVTSNPFSINIFGQVVGD
jgi:hypothetical protein